MYSEHGFEALIRAVVLHVCHRLTVVSNCMPGIAALLGCFGDLAHQFARLVAAHRLVVNARLRPVIGIFLYGVHELVRCAHAVVRVLEEDRAVRLAVER